MNSKFFIGKYIKIVILIILIMSAIFVGSVGASVVAVMKDSPNVDLSKISEALSENSSIVDESGELLEQIETIEYREVKSINDIPKYVRDAFVAVEDERFYNHMGIDLIGIGKSVIDNISAGGIVRGGSTITQQLARDLYLNDEKSLDRKIKEAYIAMKMNKSLEKDEVLEIYLNRVFLGQNAYGVQAAANTYFSKDLSDLTIAEAAALATIPKAPTEYSLYFTVRPEDAEEKRVLGEINLNGEKYFAVYNSFFEDRQKYVLSKMRELDFISQEEYENAIAEDIASALNPPERRMSDISSYFTSVVKSQVVSKLIEKYSLTKEQAQDKLYNGGLEITATIDLKMQRELEEIYENFTNAVLGSSEEEGSEVNFINWQVSESGDIVSADDNILYYSRNNLIDEDNNLFFNPGEYEYIDGDLYIQQSKIRYAESGIIIKPFYTVTENKDLKTHAATSIAMATEDIVNSDDGRLIIKASYLADNPEFIIQDGDQLKIKNDFYSIDEEGTYQPQSSTVVIDHKTGHIKAIIGGRGQSGQSILNRAYNSVRQPGSTMKPLAVYAPALDNGYTLASPIDDLPHYNDQKELWPVNWYGNYRGIMTLRKSIEVSANVNAVKTLEKIGLEKSKNYLAKFGLINNLHPEMDNFISKQEDPYTNDENTAAMALGGMTYGVTNVDLTAAYAAIANKGTYIEPLSFSKVTDRKGNIILENEPNTEEVIGEDVAFLLQDALRTTTLQGIAENAQVEGFEIAGKTGTSGTATENQDSWFMGFSPYYTVGVWMGCDDAQLKLKEVSIYSTKLWSTINTKILEGKESISFKKPSNIVEVEVCTVSGKLPTDACRADYRDVVQKEYFVKGTEPKKECDVHVWKTVDRNDGLLITERTPESERVTRSFITRIDKYDPEKNNFIYPEDWDMMAPTIVSPIYYKTQEEIEQERKE
ncbi:MAG: transglycosylase domain-containing protein, partial [Tissierellia bacterium]|nr:transglycosylase domain-containing protein [Tissierellia bacterium]